MISIDKPQQAPKVLRDRGKKKRRANCNSYTRNKTAYNTGKKTFEFNSKIYGHKTVKQALKTAQHDKCCFCESKVTHVAYGDVEHFRPKAGVRQKPKDSLGRPGYYWLAYEWSNLFFSCQLCNQRFKGNLFPLKNPGDRAISHHDDISAEKPKFISPAENPEQYIAFRQEIPYAIDGNPKGKATIEALGLGRDELNDMRKGYFDELELIYQIATLGLPDALRRKAKRFINKCLQSSSQYTSMVRCAVKSGFETI